MADYEEIVRADSTAYTGDETEWPSADGGLLVNLVSVVEPCGPIVTADELQPTADHVGPVTADGGILAGATDIFDAEVIAESAVGGGGGFVPSLRPFPVVGVGYGILPALEGEAHGLVVVAGAGAGTLGLGGRAAGTAGVAGRSAGQIIVRAAAIGDRGQVGAAVAVLKGLSLASKGVVGAIGSGGAVIVLKGAAVGQHDDDETAIVAWLLAA